LKSFLDASMSQTTILFSKSLPVGILLVEGA
jgi:hypothetical protein